jgi:hypothetical protein
LIERGRAARVQAVAALLDGTSDTDLAALRRAAEVIARALAVHLASARP